MKFMKKSIALLLAGAMAVSVTACGGSTTTASGSTGSAASTNLYAGTTDPNTVTVDMRTEPPELNTTQTQDTASADILRMVMSGLVRLDKDDNAQPDMAEKWDISADKKTYTFHLRKDAKWSNGDPVTAKDFLYAWKQGMDQSNGATYAFILYTNIKNGQAYFDATKTPAAKRTAAEKAKVDAAEKNLGCKAADDYTLTLTLENPLPYALPLMAFTAYMPLDQKAYESIGADKYAKEASQIVTNGAYKISEWVHDDHITLAKNDSYWNAANNQISNVKYLMMKDTNARMNAFKGAQVDCINLTGDQITQMKAEGQPIESYVAGSNWYFQYNTKKKGLDNANIRKALGEAINVNSFIKDVLKDDSVVADGLVPTNIKGADSKPYAEGREKLVSYNVDEAKTLLEKGLKETGLTKDSLKLTFITDDTSAAQQQAAFFQEQWKSTLGISVELKPMSFKARIAAMNQGDFDIVMAGWSPDYNDAMTFLDMWTTGNGNNNGKYSNPEYDKLIAAATKESDAAKRQDDLRKAEKLVASTDCAVYPLYFQVVPYVTSAKISGMTRSGFQEYDFTDGAKITTK
ncbi:MULTISPECIES: peptide ABC transporter substrate-binding protein [Caproicibacterium]|uniref:Peptide ABC transporter substrate-binding protein n=1 Tax=Caproicibacterium argilliputei TaxID=3030016 RepID=A0AA97D8L8_9FIRM|nr:peptide ABC transporter substrate-binding protein [Caproicibacterium argilliputei]WOC31692.1 peptide ABC transporter substrate-binding protein [Caproicibacterium argilliputei]